MTLSTEKPNYLSLSCSINGYNGITRYNSKLREGFRLRDSSLGTRIIDRDTSPANFRSSETLNPATQGRAPKSQSLSPLAMERHRNGFTNSVQDKYKIEDYVDSSKGADSCEGYSEVDRSISSSVFHQCNLAESPSPVRTSTPNKLNSSIGPPIAAYNQHNTSYYSNISSSSPKSTCPDVGHSTYSGASVLKCSSESENSTLNWWNLNEKSSIQQRVERLYGPGALVQGFFFKRSSVTRLNLSGPSCGSSKEAANSFCNNNNNNNNTSLIVNTSIEESLKNLPVLRYLRPEFRAQLSVACPRRPTNGTEQIIKSSKRVTISPAKYNAKEHKANTIKQESNITVESKMTASPTSLTDQQPAAAKVILPVLERSASLINISKQSAVKTFENVLEKDGHYFMSVLDKERERLIALANKAESELSNSGASALPEEVAGKFRSAAGKARLLASQKMKQFEGLCQKNINQVPGKEFPTTSEDLAGFWDMVMLQVVQVNDLFEEIELLRKSQWQEFLYDQKSVSTMSQNVSAVKRRTMSASKYKSTTNSEAARKAREAREQTRRQLIEEKRRAMRSNAKISDNSVEIFVPES